MPLAWLGTRAETGLGESSGKAQHTGLAVKAALLLMPEGLVRRRQVWISMWGGKCRVFSSPEQEGMERNCKCRYCQERIDFFLTFCQRFQGKGNSHCLIWRHGQLFDVILVS